MHDALHQTQTYRTDAHLLADIARGIYIDLVASDGGELFGELLKDRADDLAWATPCCPKVDDSDLIPANLWAWVS
jgi:hypothetical protein